jgi:DNA-binding transcriptional regulator GbsR (MarR family)
MEKFRHDIEDTAMIWEQLGLTPVAARVYSYILFAPHYSTSFEDLTDYFVVSKSAISNAIKYLNLVGMLGYKTKSGRRKRYFGAELNFILKEENAVKKYKQMLGMLERIQKKRKENDGLKEELDEMTSFFVFAIREYPNFLERWKKQKKKE